MSFGTIYTLPQNFRAAKTLIAAKYSGLEVKEVTFDLSKPDKPKEFVEKFKYEKIPGFVGADGFSLHEASAIALYVCSSGTSKLLPKDPKGFATVMKWVTFSDMELNNITVFVMMPIFGLGVKVDYSDKKVYGIIQRSLKYLDEELSKSKYLCGGSITYADISVFTALMSAFKMAFTDEFLKSFPHLVTWYKSLLKEPNFSSVVGSEYVTCKSIPEVVKEALTP